MHTPHCHAAMLRCCNVRAHRELSGGCFSVWLVPRRPSSLSRRLGVACSYQTRSVKGLKLSTSQGGGGKTGLDVWDGALLLTDHLLTSGGSFEEQRVVELGAGTGMVGLALARAGAHVWLTDGSQQVLSLLERNVEANASTLPHRPRVRLLRWGDQSDLEELTVELGQSNYSGTGVVDLVVLSECVYGDSAGEGSAALLDTVTALCSSTNTRVILSYTLRPVLRSKSNPSDYLCPVSFDEVPFFREAARRGFSVRQLERTAWLAQAQPVTAPMRLEMRLRG